MDKVNENQAVEPVPEECAEQEAAQPQEGAEELPESVTLSKEEFKQAREHIAQLQKERDDTVQLAQRLQADFDNYRKRNAAIHLESVDEGARSVIKELLPVLDNFDRAVASCQEESGWAEGVKLVYKQLGDVLAKCGLEEVPAEGMFDPVLHEAVMQEEAPDAESGSILMVLQKGYRVKGRIIRHSMVKVAK